jgi:hypothetical protein
MYWRLLKRKAGDHGALGKKCADQQSPITALNAGTKWFALAISFCKFTIWFTVRSALSASGAAKTTERQGRPWYLMQNVHEIFINIARTRLRRLLRLGNNRRKVDIRWRTSLFICLVGHDFSRFVQIV